MAMGVSVLAVDPSVEHLLHLSSSLRFFNYQVMTCQKGADALSLLKKSGTEFQILLAEVELPDMDGFELLAAVKSEFKSVQVVLFSSSNAVYDAAAVRALNQGACAFYTKPIPMEVVQHVWQHVYRRKIQTLPPPLPVICPVQKKRKRDNDDPKSGVIIEQGQEGKKLNKTVTGPKKPRLHWSPELCTKFVAAIEVIGIDNITVRKIINTMEKMGVVGLTVPQVSSHLQHYRKRLPLKKNSSSEEESSQPSSSKHTSSASQKHTTSSAAAVESYFSDQQLPEITSTDYTTTSQQSSQTTSYGGVIVDSGAEDFDWCFNLDLSFLETSEPEVITNLLACS